MGSVKERCLKETYKGDLTRLSPLEERHLSKLIPPSKYYDKEELYIRANRELVKLFGVGTGIFRRKSKLLTLEDISKILEKHKIEEGEKAVEFAKKLVEFGRFELGRNIFLTPYGAKFEERCNSEGSVRYVLRVYSYDEAVPY